MATWPTAKLGLQKATTPFEYGTVALNYKLCQLLLAPFHLFVGPFLFLFFSFFDCLFKPVHHAVFVLLVHFVRTSLLFLPISLFCLFVPRSFNTCLQHVPTRCLHLTSQYDHAQYKQKQHQRKRRQTRLRANKRLMLGYSRDMHPLNRPHVWQRRATLQFPVSFCI